MVDPHYKGTQAAPLLPSSLLLTADKLQSEATVPYPAVEDKLQWQAAARLAIRTSPARTSPRKPAGAAADNAAPSGTSSTAPIPTHTSPTPPPPANKLKGRTNQPAGRAGRRTELPDSVAKQRAAKGTAK